MTSISITILTALLTLGTLPSFAGPTEAMQSRVRSMETQLQALPHYSLRGGMGTIGYRSRAYEDAENSEWIEIRLDQDETLDAVVLVPVVRHGAREGFRAEGFPRRFRILAGSSDPGSERELAQFDRSEEESLGIAPLVIPCSVTAGWVRVEASLLSSRSVDGRYNLELAEILLFRGEENLALHREVLVPPYRLKEGDSARAPRFLVDGFLPYQMHSGQGEPSLAYVAKLAPRSTFQVTLDLGRVLPVDRIHFHQVELGDTIPRSHPSNFAFPEKFSLLGDRDAAFSSPTLLLQEEILSPYDAGPILIRRVPPTACRFLRLQVEEPYSIQKEGTGVSMFGLAEIEAFSGGRNVSAGASVTASSPEDSYARSLAALTDGRNIYGNLLPLRAWLEALAARESIERALPLLQKQLEREYLRQQQRLRQLALAIVFLAAGILIVFLLGRLRMIRAVAGVKERLAADLHDELGANLHAIGMLNTLAGEARSEAEREGLHRRIADLSERTATSIRSCTALLEGEEFSTDLLGDLQRTAERIATNLDHAFDVQGAEYLQALSPRKRIDLFLFYKECLINTCRHSGARKLRTSLIATQKELMLQVTDDGQGTDQGLPSSLRRRAHLLRGQVRFQSDPGEGATITLRLRLKRNPLNGRRSHD